MEEGDDLWCTAVTGESSFPAEKPVLRAIHYEEFIDTDRDSSVLHRPKLYENEFSYDDAQYDYEERTDSRHEKDNSEHSRRRARGSYKEHSKRSLEKAHHVRYEQRKTSSSRHVRSTNDYFVDSSRHSPCYFEHEVEKQLTKRYVDAEGDFRITIKNSPLEPQLDEHIVAKKENTRYSEKNLNRLYDYSEHRAERERDRLQSDIHGSHLKERTRLEVDCNTPRRGFFESERSAEKHCDQNVPHFKSDYYGEYDNHYDDYSEKIFRERSRIDIRDQPSTNDYRNHDNNQSHRNQSHLRRDSRSNDIDRGRRRFFDDRKGDDDYRYDERKSKGTRDEDYDDRNYARMNGSGRYDSQNYYENRKSEWNDSHYREDRLVDNNRGDNRYPLSQDNGSYRRMRNNEGGFRKNNNRETASQDKKAKFNGVDRGRREHSPLDQDRSLNRDDSFLRRRNFNEISNTRNEETRGYDHKQATHYDYIKYHNSRNNARNRDTFKTFNSQNRVYYNEHNDRERIDTRFADEYPTERYERMPPLDRHNRSPERDCTPPLNLYDRSPERDRYIDDDEFYLMKNKRSEITHPYASAYQDSIDPYHVEIVEDGRVFYQRKHSNERLSEYQEEENPLRPEDITALSRQGYSSIHIVEEERRRREMLELDNNPCYPDEFEVRNHRRDDATSDPDVRYSCNRPAMSDNIDVNHHQHTNADSALVQSREERLPLYTNPPYKNEPGPQTNVLSRGDSKTNDQNTKFDNDNADSITAQPANGSRETGSRAFRNSYENVVRGHNDIIYIESDEEERSTQDKEVNSRNSRILNSSRSPSSSRKRKYSDTKPSSRSKSRERESKKDNVRELLISAGEESVSKYKKSKQTATLFTAHMLSSIVQSILPAGNIAQPNLLVNRFPGPIIYNPVSVPNVQPNIPTKEILDQNKQSIEVSKANFKVKAKALSELCSDVSAARRASNLPNKSKPTLKEKRIMARKKSGLPVGEPGKRKVIQIESDNEVEDKVELKDRSKAPPWFDDNLLRIFSKYRKKKKILEEAQRDSTVDKNQIEILKAKVRAANKVYFPLQRERRAKYFDELEKKGEHREICENVLSDLLKKVVSYEHLERSGRGNAQDLIRKKHERTLRAQSQCMREAAISY